MRWAQLVQRTGATSMNIPKLIDTALFVGGLVCGSLLALAFVYSVAEAIMGAAA